MNDSLTKWPPNYGNNETYDVVLVLRDWDKTKAGSLYMHSIKILYDILNGLHLRCRFIIFSKKDKDAIAIAKKLSNQVLVWGPDFAEIDDFMSILSCHKLLITSRYHGAVCSSLLSIPFISINIEPKLRMISDLFGMPSWDAPFKGDVMRRYVSAILNDYSKCQNQIEVNSEIQSEKAREMMTKFGDYLEMPKA